MNRSLLAVTIFLSGVACKGTANAEFIIQFGQGGDIGVTTFEASAGTTLLLDVYLTQQGFASPGVGEYRLSSGSDIRGLGSFYFDAGVSNALDGDGQTGIRHAPIDRFAYGSSFSDQTMENGYLDAVGGDVVLEPTSATRFVGFTQLDPLDFSKVLPAYVTETYQITGDANTGNIFDNSLLLGTLVYEIAPNAFGVYDIGLSAPGGFRRPSLGHDPFAGQFDAQFVGATINVTAVPEPTSLVLVTGALGIGLARYRFKRTKGTGKRVHGSNGVVDV